MADLETAFREFVLADTAIKSKVGEKFFWNRVNDGATYPYIRGTTIADPPIHYQNKRKGSRLSKATIQMDVFSDKKPDCNELADMLRDMLDGFRGSFDEYNVRILARDVPSSFAEEQKSYRRIVEVEVAYARP